MEKQIETERLRLVACDSRLLEIALAGNGPLQEYLGVTVPQGWTEFGPGALRYAMDKLKDDETQAGWWTWLPIHKADNRLIGSCGFKGKPGADGKAEIGYEIMPAYRMSGLATELAAGLAAHAFRDPRVTTVQAHTLGERNASVRVLEKCGFTLAEEIVDKEDGTLWRWEMKKS